MIAIDTEYTFVIVNAIILVATVILCSIVIPILVQDKKTKKITKLFLLSLCISDLVRVVLGSGFLMRVGTGLKMIDTSCLYGISLFGTSQLASSLVTVVTSLDRYFAVGFPFKYHATMTENVSYIIIGMNWAVVLLIGSMFIVFRRPFEELPPMVKANASSISCLQFQYTIREGFLTFFSLGLTVPSIIIIVVTTTRIYFIMKGVYNKTPNRISFIFWIKTQFADGNGEVNTKRGALMGREIRATFNLLLPVINFVAVWTPVICFRMAQVFGRIRYTETFVYTIFTVLQIYSMVNPFLYIFTVKHHKAAVKKLLARVFCCNSEVTTSNRSQTDEESIEKVV